MKRKVLVAFAVILMTSMLVGTGTSNQVKANVPVIIVGDLCMSTQGTCTWQFPDGDVSMPGAMVI